jgi:Heparinase II/III N-terminus/Heparinase II/III-like protein
MKRDKMVAHETLISGEALLRTARVEGKRKTVRDAGRELLAMETGALVRIDVPRSDLSPMNVLVLNLKLLGHFEGSLVTRLDYTTRAPGMSDNDLRISIRHFNQPTPWNGWQRILIPAENLVATGFPDGWKDIASIGLDVHSRLDHGWVAIGDIELLQVEKPRGLRMSDDELLAALDLERKELSTVARHAQAGQTNRAITALAAAFRRAAYPPSGSSINYPHSKPPSADDICNHLILEQQLPRKIDWQCNPIGYLEWNHKFNRHVWMTTLTDAFKHAGGTRRRRYARELDALMRSWIQQNPEPAGHNGGLDPAWETLSTSCRINWAWPHVVEVARTSRQISDRTLVDMVKMVHAHAEHLLSYWGHCNWFISESTAILTAAAMFPMFRRADHWRRTAMRRLQKEMRAQVFADGVQFELSPGYHTMCADLLYLAHIRAGFRGWHFSKTFTDRLWKMYDYLAAIARPDGTYPVMNDAGTSCQKGNARLLSVGRAEKRPEWIWAGSGGDEGRPPKAGSIAFPDAGYAVMRSGWEADDRWAFFDMAEFGAAHQHDDKLQVELYAHGTPLVIDPGISSYQQDPMVRFFRRSHAHNTVIIDGTGQWQRSTGNYARFCSSSRGKNLWASGRILDIARGVYDGPYGARECGAALLANTNATKPITGIAHTRLLVFARPDYWLVLDSIVGRGRHLAEALWHFTPMHVRIDADASIVRTNRLGHGNLELICRGDWAKGTLDLVTGSETPTVQGFVAIDNEVKPAPCAVVGREKPLPIHGATVAVPYASGSESHFRVTTSNVRGSRGKGMLITVRRADGLTDRFLWRHTGSGAMEAKGLKVDGLFGLVRTDANGAVACAALADGRSLKADGVSLRGKAGKLVEA